MVAYRDWQNKRDEIEESQNTNIGSDFIDLAQQGILQTGAGVANFLGAETTADSLDQWANEQNETLTPEMRTAMAKDIINDDMSFGEGAKDWRTWLGSAANVLGGMAATMVPGGLAGKGAAIAGGSARVASGANVSTNALLNLAAGNGGQSLNVKKEIENADFGDLAESPTFRQYAIEASDSGLSDEESLNVARQRIADEAAHAVKTDFTLGAVNLIAETVGDQAFAKLLKGSIGKTIKGAIGKGILTEGTTEAVQGGVEEYRTNVNVNEVQGIEGDNMEGVGASALESGLLGAFIGGGAGAPSGAVAKYRRRNFENQIESAITPEVVSQLRGAGKADQEIEQLLKPKIENKALSMGFDANEAQSLSSLAINAAFGRAPRAADRHTSEDLNEQGGANEQQPQQPQQQPQQAQPQPQPEAAQPQTPPIQQEQAPENLFSSFNHSDLVRDAQQAVSSIKAWEKQNRGNEHAKQLRQDMGRYLSTLNNGLSDEERQSAQRSMQSIYNEYLYAIGQQPAAPIENNGDPVQSEMFNQDTGEIYEPNSIEQPPAPEQQPAQLPEPVSEPSQSAAMSTKDHGLLVQAIQGGELDFADEQAQQDDRFRQGLERAFEYSPAAVLQVAQARKKGQMSEEQAISALQRVINSVELNKPDQLRPTDEEMILRNQQAQERNNQQQLEERGIRNNGHQPNVEESPEFQRNQAKLMQGMRERQQTKGYAGGQQWNGERDATPMPTGIEDQQVRGAPQVEFDRWSDVQSGDQYVDDRYSSEANEYELNPEEYEQVTYRQPNIVAQEPATAPKVEERKPKHNARQAKKLSKQQAEQAAEFQRQLEAERAEIEAENAPVYQTPGLSQRSDLSRQLGKARAEQSINGRQKVNRLRGGSLPYKDKVANSNKLIKAVEKEVDLTAHDNFENAWFDVDPVRQHEILKEVFGESVSKISDIWGRASLQHLTNGVELAKGRQELPRQKLLGRARELMANVPSSKSKTQWKAQINQAIDGAGNDLKQAHDSLDHIISRAYNANEIGKLQKQGEATEKLKAKAKPEKVKTLKPKKLGDDIPAVTLAGDANRRRVYPTDEKGQPYGTWFSVHKDTTNKEFVIFGVDRHVREKVRYGNGVPLARAIDITNEKVSNYADVVRAASRKEAQSAASNMTEQRKEFNKRWDNLPSNERRKLVKAAMPDSSSKLNNSRVSLSGKDLELAEYNKIESQMARSDNEALSKPAKATARQSHKGVDLEYPEISKEIENQYNRATHLGRGRDFNQEFHDQAKSLLDDLDSKGLLDTPERKAKAKQLIEKYLDESAQFVNWSSHQAASNPSWHITGRSGRDMSKYNDRAQKRAHKEVSKIDRLIGMKNRIPEQVESVMNDEQKAAKEAKGKETLLKNRESEIIGYLVGDIFSYMQDGRELLAKENRKWALAKAKKSLENLVYNDKSRAEKLLKAIDKKARQESNDKFSLMDIVGNKRSALGKYIAENFEGFNSTKPKSTKLAMPANTSRAVKGKLGKIATAQKKVEEAENNLVKVETANSSDRFAPNPNNPRIKAANGRVKTAQKAVDAAYDELGEIWKGFKSAGGTQQQWDKVVNDKQGNVDTHSWDELEESFGDDEDKGITKRSTLGDKPPATTINESAIDALQAVSDKFEENPSTRVKNYELEPAWKEVSKLMEAAGADTHDLYSFGEWITSQYKSDRDKAIELAKKYLNGDPEPTPPNGGGTKPKAKEATSKPAAPKAKKGRTRPSDARAYVKAISDFNGGNYSQSEAVELINQFIEDVPKLEEEFQGHTKPQIVNLFARMGYFIDGTLKKDQLVSRAVDSIGSQLGAFLSDGGVFVVKKPQAVSEEIAAMTESAYDEMAKSRRDMRAEAEAEAQRKKEALQEPKTLDDFQAYARANGGTIDAFTDQQLSEFDRLYTENQLQRNAEKEKRELEQKAQVKAVETDGTIALSKIDVLNEAKGEQRYGAAFSEVDSDTYNEMKAKAKQLGGWYARAYKPKNLPARFDFKTEQSRDDFLSVMGGLNVDQSERVKQRAQEKTQTKQEKQTEALRQKADALQAKVDESNSTSRLTNTARRASFAASAAAKADRQEVQANILRKIADGVESGRFMLLGNLTDMSQLEELTKVMSRVKWDLPENVREKLAYRDTQGNWHLKPETTFEQVARYVRFPAPQSTPASLEYIAREIENLSGYKMTAKSIRSNIKGMKENDRINLNGARWDKVIPKLRELARSSSNNVYRVEHINELFKSQDRLIRMGIKGDITLRQALREYEQANNGKMSTRKEKTRLETLTEKIEDIVRGNRNAFNDFFPTPEAEVNQLIDLADIQPGMRVLEPNAGMGHIADQIASLNGVDLDVGELAHTMSELLEEKGHNVVSGDFLEYHPGEIYDRIVMNPPFSNDADIHHINHALSMLKEGGKLVAITSSMAGNRGNTTNKNFRRYLDEVAAEEIPLAAGTFNKSLNPTGVATKIVVIEKQADIDYDDMRFSQTSEVEAKPVTSMAPGKVTQAAQDWINAYDGFKGVNLTVVPTMEDLHDLVETEHNAIVKGAWLSGDNRVVLVAENLKDVADVRRTLRHELIAHNGLYGTLSTEQQAKLTKQVESLRNNKALQGIFSEVDKSYKTAPDTVKAEEVIARIAEQESSLPRRLMDQVLTWALGALRRSGILSAERVTLSEVRTMINNVDSNLRKPNGMTSLSNAVRFSQTLKGMTDAEANQTDNLASVQDALNVENEKAYKHMLGKLKNDWLTKQYDSMKNGGWALLNLRQIAEVGRRRVSNEVGNILDSYVATKDLFTTRKTDLIEKVHAQAESLNKFRRDNPEAAEQTFDLLHQATLADIDPSDAYKPRTDELKKVERQLSRLYMEYGGSQTKRGSEVYQELEQTRRDIKGEGKRKIKHAALRDKYLALSPEAQKVFTDVRDHYVSQREEMDKALENRVNELAVAGSVQAGQNTYHRIMMEKARLGFYVPLGRFGQYWLSVQDSNGERHFQMYETEADMMQDVNKLQAGGYKLNNGTDEYKNGELKYGTKLNDSRGLSGASASFVSDVVKAVSGANVNDKVKDQLTDEIYQMYLSTMPDRSIRRAFIHRKGVAGFSEDAARVLADQGVRQANQQARLETEKQFSDLMENLKIATEASNNVSAGRLYNEMTLRHEWMMNPTRAKWAQSLTAFGFFWQIGISPASAMINLSQNWQVALPVIGAKYGFKATAAEMGKLSVQFAKTFAAKKKRAGVRGDMDMTNGILGDILNDEEKAALRHAIKIGAIDVTQMADLTGMAEQESSNYTGKMASLSRFIGAPFHWAEVMNREVAFITAYRMAKANGEKKADALDYATKATWDSHFDYSSRNRARFMQGDVAAVALQFRQYSQNMTYYLFRNAFDAMRGADMETKKLARRQLLATFGTTFAVGGLNALPLATLAAIANVTYAMTFGDENEPWDAETELQAAINEAFGEDFGKHIYYGTMPSVSSRINIDLLRMWVQDADAQNSVSWVENLGQQAMGVSFGTAVSFARGADYFIEGQTMRGIEQVTPKWIKDVFRTARYANEGGNITNRKGEILVSDVEPLEYVGQFLGFTPGRLVQQYDKNSALKGYEMKAVRRRQKLMNAYWLAYRTKDNEALKEVQKQINRHNVSEWGKVNPITSETIMRTIKQRRRLMSKSINGTHLNERYEALLNSYH
ncbi:TPA: PLxRFG domain-containing protein [Vibrio parahaemolyticus]|nr:PLxRFG domain-containing protein [Vibrio parahaemolyticus]